MQSMLICLWNGRCSFVFTTLVVHTITPTTYTENIFLCFSQLSPPFFNLLFNKIIFTIPTNAPFLSTAAFFHLPIFAYNHPSNLHQKYFPSLSHLANSGCVKRQRSYGVMWGFLIFLFFLKIWTVITGLTITDSLLLRLTKLMYFR